MPLTVDWVAWRHDLRATLTTQLGVKAIAIQWVEGMMLPRPPRWQNLLSCVMFSKASRKQSLRGGGSFPEAQGQDRGENKMEMRCWFKQASDHRVRPPGPSEQIPHLEQRMSTWSLSTQSRGGWGLAHPQAWWLLLPSPVEAWCSQRPPTLEHNSESASANPFGPPLESAIPLSVFFCFVLFFNPCPF